VCQEVSFVSKGWRNAANFHNSGISALIAGRGEMSP